MSQNSLKHCVFEVVSDFMGWKCMRERRGKKRGKKMWKKKIGNNPALAGWKDGTGNRLINLQLANCADQKIAQKSRNNR